MPSRRCGSASWAAARTSRTGTTSTAAPCCRPRSTISCASRSTPREDRQVRVRSLDLGHLVEYGLDEGPEYDGVMDLAKAAIDRIGVPGGVRWTSNPKRPPAAGLGGSSALVTAVRRGARHAAGARDDADRRARAAGLRDRTRRPAASAAGGRTSTRRPSAGCNLIEFRSTGVQVTPVASEPARLEDLRRNLLLCYTGKVRRNVGLIDTQIELFRSGREETLLGMKQLVEMAYAMREVIEAGDVDRLGQMLHDAFEAKKRMNPHIADHTPIEAMLDAARDAGASGGKICGAGGGGYLLIACTPDVRAAVALGAGVHGWSVRPVRLRPRRRARDAGRPGLDAHRHVSEAPPVRAARPRRDDQRRGRPPVRSRRTGADPRLGRGDPKAARGLGLGIVVVTNQANVGRGLLSTGPARCDPRASPLDARPPRARRSMRSCSARTPPRTTARAASRDRAWPSRQPNGSGSIPRTRSSWAITPATWAWAGRSGPPRSS